MSNRIPPDPITNLTELVQEVFRRIINFATSGKWFSLLILLVVLLFLLFAPETGWIYPSIANVITSPKQYTAIFWLVFFSLISIYLLIQGVSLIRRSRGWIQALIIGLLVLLLIITTSILWTRIRSLPGGVGTYLSYGEESLFIEGSPEGEIYKRNRKAIRKNRKPLKIAVSVPISRNNGIYHSNEILRGVAIAQEEWNNNNENLQVVVGIADDGYEKGNSNSGIPSIKRAIESAQDIAKILVQDPDLLAVIGHFGSNVTEAAAPIYKEGKLVTVSPTSTALREKNGKCDPNLNSSICLNEYIFRTAIDDQKSSDLLAQTITSKNKIFPDSKKIERVAIIFDSNSSYSKSFKTAFKDRFEHHFTEKDDNGNNRIIINEKCDLSRSNFQETKGIDCLNVIKNEADAILFIPGELETAFRVNGIIEANYSLGDESLFLLGSDTMYQYEFVVKDNERRKDTQGMLIPLTWHRSGIKECTEQYSQELECKAAKLFPRKKEKEKNKPLAINWRTATAYESAKAIFEGLKLAKKSCNGFLNLKLFKNRECMRKELKNILDSDEFKNLDIQGAKTNTSISYHDGERYFSKGLGVVVEANNKSFSVLQ